MLRGFRWLSGQKHLLPSLMSRVQSKNLQDKRNLTSSAPNPSTNQTQSSRHPVGMGSECPGGQRALRASRGLDSGAHGVLA